MDMGHKRIDIALAAKENEYRLLTGHELWRKADLVTRGLAI